MSDELPIPAITAATLMATESSPFETHVEKSKEKNKKKFVSAGKRVHNELTYRGVDFLLNSTIGVAFTYWTQRTQNGREYWAKPVSNFFKTILTPILKTPAAIEQGAKRGAMFASIIVGGMAIVAPMVMLEKKKNKKAIIARINERIHGEEKIENDPRFAQELENIDHEPKKNFTIGMAARGIVLAPMLWATFTPAIDKHLVKYLYSPIARFSKGACKTLGIQPKTLMERGVMELAEGDISKAPTFVSDWDFIHNNIGFDFGLTFIYSFAHEAVIKTLAAMGLKQTEEEIPNQQREGRREGIVVQNGSPPPGLPTAGGGITPQTSASVSEFIHAPEHISEVRL